MPDPAGQIGQGSSLDSTESRSEACEYTHERDDPCSGPATHTLHRHGKVQRICDAAKRRVEAKSSQPCITCRKPKWTHWDIFPITPDTNRKAA